jgi:hypothetical protein
VHAPHGGVMSLLTADAQGTRKRSCLLVGSGLGGGPAAAAVGRTLGGARFLYHDVHRADVRRLIARFVSECKARPTFRPGRSAETLVADAAHCEEVHSELPGMGVPLEDLLAYYRDPRCRGLVEILGYGSFNAAASPARVGPIESDTARPLCVDLYESLP